MMTPIKKKLWSYPLNCQGKTTQYQFGDKLQLRITKYD